MLDNCDICIILIIKTFIVQYWLLSLKQSFVPGRLWYDKDSIAALEGGNLIVPRVLNEVYFPICSVAHHPFGQLMRDTDLQLPSIAGSRGRNSFHSTSNEICGASVCKEGVIYMKGSAVATIDSSYREVVGTTSRHNLLIRQGRSIILKPHTSLHRRRSRKAVQR